MSKPNNLDAVRIQHDMLKVTATWPEENSTFSYRFREMFIYSFCVILGFTMLIQAVNDRTDFAKLSDILYILITVAVYLIKHATFFRQRETFINMMKHLQRPIFSSYSDQLNHLMIERIKISRLISNALRISSLGYCGLVSISPLFDRAKSLPFPFPYELGNYRIFMYVFQACTISLLGWTNTTLDTLSACLMGVAATQLQILSKEITSIKIAFTETRSNSENNKTIPKELRKCVIYHLSIIEFVECIDKVFSFGALSQFFGSALIICNTLFNLIWIPIGLSQFFKLMMLITYFGAALLQLFMYCWFGNEIITKSISIGEACYLCDWYNCGNSIAKDLFIVMERSKRPLKITAYKFSTLSLNAFTSIIQWSYSYFALLMNLYKKQAQYN